MKSLIIANNVGRKFRVDAIEVGEFYGLNKSLLNKEERLIEFYDLSFPEKFGEKGQFVQRYSYRTLLERVVPNGLILHGGVPEWKIDSNAMEQVDFWLLFFWRKEGRNAVPKR